MATTPVSGPPQTTPELDTGDMQGLVARAYGHLPSALYVPLQIGDPAAARAWLASVVDDVTSAAKRRE